MPKHMRWWLLILWLVIPTRVWAQTVNPTQLEFPPSPDHDLVWTPTTQPLVTRYQLDCTAPGGTPVTLDLGKPTPQANLIGPIVVAEFSTITVGPIYTCVVSAVGPGGTTPSTAPTNAFVRTGAPPSVPAPRPVPSGTVSSQTPPPIPPIAGWETAGGPCPSASGVSAILVKDLDLWAACGTAGVKRSADGGATWTDLGAPGVNGTPAYLLWLRDTPYGVVAVANTPGNANGTWRFVAPSWVKSDIPTLSIVAANYPDVIYHQQTQELLAYFVSGGGLSIFVSTDGDHFTLRRQGIHAGLGYGIYQAADGCLWESTEAAGQPMSCDAGASFTSQGTHVNGYYYGESPEGTLYYAERTSVWKRVTGSWVPAETGLPSTNTYGFLRFGTHFFAMTAILGSATVPAVYERVGSAWVPFKAGATNPTGTGRRAWAVTSSGVLYLGLRDGTVRRTTVGP